MKLSKGIFLELQNVVFIPSTMRNSISLPVLDRLGYSFLFGIGKVDLYQDFLLIDNRTFWGNLYRLKLYDLPSVFVFVIFVNNTKCLRLSKKSFVL